MTSQEKGRSKSGISGMIFVGCIMVGLGVGIFTNTVAPSIIVALGVGFIGMALARYATGEW